MNHHHPSLSLAWNRTLCIMLGCFATLTQVVLFHELLIVLSGNELTLGLLLSGWLLGVSLGSYIPNYLSIDRSSHGWLRGALLLVPLALWFSVLWIRFAPLILSIPITDKPSPVFMAVIALTAIIPAGTIFGLAFPLMSLSFKTDRSTKSTSAAWIGTVFSFESMGSVGAGILITLKILIVIQPLLLAAIMLSLITFTFWLIESGWKQRGAWIAIFLVSILLIATGQPNKWQDWSNHSRWEYAHPGYKLVHSLDTPYQYLEIGERDQQYSVIGNGTPLFSFPDLYQAPQWAHMSLSQSPQPESILLLGGGGNDLNHSLIEHKPTTLVCGEMDPGIIDLLEDIQPTQDINENKVFRQVVTDPRRLLYEMDERFSTIIVNQPDPSNGLLNRLYTRDFFQLALSKLAPDGVFVITTKGTPNYQSGDVGFYNGTLYWTMRDVFENVIVVPGIDCWFFASPSRTLLSDPDLLAKRYERTGVEILGFSPDYYSLYYDPQRIARVNRELNDGQYYPRNTDNRPLCYLYDLIVWGKQYGNLKRLDIERIASNQWMIYITGIMVLLILLMLHWIIAWMIGGKLSHCGAPLTILFGTGLTSMGTEIAIMLFFQSKVGCLYQQVGLFFGTFMLGLALGGSIGVRMVNRGHHNITQRLLRIDALYTLVLMITIGGLGMLSSPFIHPMLVECLLLAGLLLVAVFSGMIFPIAAQALESGNAKTTQLAARAVASDNIGGAIGALISGTLLIPILGITGTLLLFVILKSVNLIVAYRLS
jgi:spermidine synthase